MSDTNIKEVLEAYIREIVRSEIASILTLAGPTQPKEEEPDDRKCVIVSRPRIRPLPCKDARLVGKEETVHLLQTNPTMAKLTTERVSARSTALFSMSRVVSVNSVIYQGAMGDPMVLADHHGQPWSQDPPEMTLREETSVRVVEFWSRAVKRVPGWHQVAEGHMKASELRQTSLTCSALFLKALTELYCRSLSSGSFGGATRMFEQVAAMDWSRDNPVWEDLFQPCTLCADDDATETCLSDEHPHGPRIRRDRAAACSIVEYVEEALHAALYGETDYGE
jgi:hypothetical protein